MSAARPPAVIFDLDGTLVDSAPDVASALNATLAECGLSADTAEVRGWIGDGARALLAKAMQARQYHFDDTLLSQLTANWVLIYARNPTGQSQLYPHAAETLQQLASAGMPVGVCSNKPESLVRQVLDGLGLSPFVLSLVGGGGAYKPKPHPDGLIACAAQLDRRSSETVFVGDSKIDFDTARAAACRSVLVTYGYSSHPVASLGADACIDSLLQLRETIDRLASAPDP